MLATDKDQPFIRELRYDCGGQPVIIFYLDQMLTDMAHFATIGIQIPPSPIPCDTTFNIAEYKVTLTAYRNMTVTRKDSGNHPWFPGPGMFHRRERYIDFQYFWQAVCRGKEELKNIAVLGSDECKELIDGVRSVAKDAKVFLGLEHVEKRDILISNTFGR